MIKRVVFLMATFLVASFITGCATTGFVESDDAQPETRATATARERR
jgi:hypothetical protein